MAAPLFLYKTYRCEWLAEVYVVDQYEQRQSLAEVFYASAHPTRELAAQELLDVTVPDPHVPDRRIYLSAPHGYYRTGVRYREVEVHQEHRPIDPTRDWMQV